MDNNMQNRIFLKIQEYLKPNPVIVWGSGATIPFGMPSMEDLKGALGITQVGNLEEILSEIGNVVEKETYEKLIYEAINKEDEEFKNRLVKGNDEIRPIQKLVNYFHNTHPRRLNIITTNYDCVLEYILSYHRLPFSDGFSGREFSTFELTNFNIPKHINLYKVHGSLRWHNGRYSYRNPMMDGIFPNDDKYRRASQEPYRTIISNADLAISDASCFLVVGFGFNDEHLTPKIDQAIGQRAKIVIITKKSTSSLNAKLQNAQSYVLIEEGDDSGKTKFSFNDGNQRVVEVLDGSYWRIEEFNEILYGKE